MNRRAGVLIGTVVVVATASAAAFAATRLLSGDAAAEAGSQGPPPFTVPDGEATVVAANRITVVASSHLEPDGIITYDPGNLIDDDLQTAWNSDSRQDEGRGETLIFRFSEPVDLKAVRFVNGYAKNDRVYRANHRAREVLVRTDGSDRVQPVTLLDTSDRQEITFDFGLTARVELEIIEVYPGDGFDDAALTSDLALTEIAFVAVQP